MNKEEKRIDIIIDGKYDGAPVYNYDSFRILSVIVMIVWKIIWLSPWGLTQVANRCDGITGGSGLSSNVDKRRKKSFFYKRRD